MPDSELFRRTRNIKRADNSGDTQGGLLNNRTLREMEELVVMKTFESINYFFLPIEKNVVKTSFNKFEAIEHLKQFYQ